MPEQKKLFLLDAMALIYRAYFALQRNPRITSYGRNTNAQFGFTTTLLDLINKEKPTHLAVVFEGGKSDQDVHRTNHFADYKANRQEQPEDISSALPDIRRIVEGFNLPCLESPGYEADDVIGTLALKAAEEGFQVYMVTPDKDFGQLVRDEQIFIYKPAYMGNPPEVLGEKEVCEKWDIQRVEQVIDVLGLMGDAVDNIPGIPGVGQKTAAKLLAQYGSLESVLEHANDIKGALGEKVRNGAESAIMSKQLATIMTHAPVPFEPEKFRIREWDKEALKEVFAELEFRALGKRILGEGFEPAAQGVVATDLFGQPLERGATVAAAMPTLFEDPAKTMDDVPHTYHTYIDNDDVSRLLELLKDKKEISFDTETTSKDANNASLVGLSFSWEKGTGHYVFVPDDESAARKLLARFQPFFEDENITWVGQNIKYDLLVLKWYGVELKGKIWDTMVAHYLIDADGKHGMDDLSVKYLRYQPVPIETLIGKGKNQISMREVPLEKVSQYAAEDADVTWQLKTIFAPLIQSEGAEKLLQEVETPLIPVLADMEFEGVGIDVPFLERYSEELATEMTQAEESVYKQAGTRFNLGSPKQLGEVLFDILKIDGGGKKTRTGQHATGEEVLAKLRGKHPIVDDILLYRQLSKLKSTYVDALPTLINPRTGRVHTSFNQTIAVTGRLSSNNPNLQNIPIRTERGREIRKAFITRGEGWILLSADYSQIELRIIAALADEQNMITAFAQNKDIHTTTAAAVYGVDEEAVTSTMRRNAKAVNFGIIYGQSAFGLSDKLGISRTEAKTIIDSYFEQYPAIKRYIDNQIRFARENLYVESMLGRKRWLRDITSANQTVRGFAERNAVNMPIQGTAADMIKLAMIALHRELKSRQLQTRLVLQVHDELILDVPLGELEQVKAIVKASMESALPLPNGVPVVAEAGVGENWLEAH